MEKENIILTKSLDFALQIIEFSELLENSKKYVIAKQILRSGTSIGANIREAQGAESKADFIHKMKIALKEAEETEYWLILCQHSPNYPFNQNLSDGVKELLKLLTSIIQTTQSKYKNIN